MKVRDRHRRDFSLYLRCSRSGMYAPSVPQRGERGGRSALEAFVRLESTGRRVACRQPRVFAAVEHGKRALNFCVKQWAIGYAVCGGEPWLHELMAEYDWFPPWVWDALKRQAHKQGY